MKPRNFIFLLLAGLPVCVAMAGTPVRVTLHEEVELESIRYRLGEIADIVTDDARLFAKLSNLVVGQAPRSGYNGYITRNELAAFVEREVPAAYRRLEWRGAGKVQLRAVGSAYPGDRIQRAAYERLYEYLSEYYDDFSIGLVNNETASPILPLGDVSITAYLPGAELNKRMTVWVDIHVEDMLYQSVPVWFSVSVYQEVLAAARKMERHDIPRASDFVREVSDITSLRGVPVDSMEALQGMRLKRPLSEGALLSSSMLEIVPLVVRGQQVKVFASAGKVSLSTTAIALHDGDMLQKINVQNPKRDLTYAATVIGQGRVKVD